MSESVITIAVENSRPVELEDLTAGLSGIAGLYARFMQHLSPSSGAEAHKLYVREIRNGSIIVDIVTIAGPLLDAMNNINLLSDFVRNVEAALRPFFRPGGRNEALQSKDLRLFQNMLRMVVKDPSARLSLSAARYHDGRRDQAVEFVFGPDEAHMAGANIEQQLAALAARDDADYRKVLMVFYQANTGAAAIGKRSQEKAVIEHVSPKPLPVIYASELAGEQIKAAIRGEDNPFRLGFVVDVNVETRRGKPAAYRITALHDILELDED